MTSLLPTIRVAIADDHTFVREGIRALVQLQAGVVMVAEVEDPSEVAAMLARTPCDVLLLDRSLQVSGGIDIREVGESTNVLMLHNDPDDLGDAANAIRAGARGVIFKRCPTKALIEAIRTVAAGAVWMPPELQARIATTMYDDDRTKLTRREGEIARHVASGLRNGEVARTLFISEQTVKTHISNIFRKVGVRDRVGLTLYASRLGWIGAHHPNEPATKIREIRVGGQGHEVGRRRQSA